MLNDFKKFLIKGNAIDMAVGFIFGAAFATIVKSFVNNIAMPPLGKLIGGLDFSNLFIALDGKEYESLKALEEAGAPAIKYGIFINDLISFVLLGLAIFLIVKMITNMQKKKEEEEAKNPPEPSEEVLLLREIRDALAKK